MSDKLPNVVEILDVPDLSIYEKMVYIVLQSSTNKGEVVDFPSYSDIAKNGSMSRRQAINCVQSLIEKGFIKKQIRFDETKGQKSNLYEMD